MPVQRGWCRGARFVCTNVSCGEIGTEKPLERQKQSVFHRNLEGDAAIAGAGGGKPIDTLVLDEELALLSLHTCLAQHMGNSGKLVGV